MLLHQINVFVFEFSEPRHSRLNLKWGSMYFGGILFYQLRYKLYRYIYTNLNKLAMFVLPYHLAAWLFSYVWLVNN